MFDWNIATRLSSIERQLDQIQRSLTSLHRNTRKYGELEMATLQQVLDDVSQENTQLDSVGTLLAGLRKQIQDVTSGATLPPSVQNQIDQIFARAEANKQKIADAITANTEPSPSPPAASTTDKSDPSGGAEPGGITG